MTTAHRLVSGFLFALFIVWPCNLEAQVSQGKPKVPMKENDDELRKLLRARYDEVAAELKEAIAQSTDVRFTPERVGEALQRLLPSGLELYDQPEDRVAFLSQHIELLKGLENAL